MPPTREPYKHYHNDALANILFLASLQDQLFHSLEYWTGLDLRLIYFLDYFLTFFHFFPTAPSYLVLPEFCLTVPGTEGAGGSNSYRSRLWKKKLQEFCDSEKIQISVCHFPPG